MRATRDADQSPSPSSLLARTCTWYSVSIVSPVIVARVPVKSCGPAVKSGLSRSRYCRS